ncbi:hypothetical protein [Bacillus canaveralius]|nr:hypothetical protein [Bacillus canaveralius]
MSQSLPEGKKHLAAALVLLVGSEQGASAFSYLQNLLFILALMIGKRN